MSDITCAKCGEPWDAYGLDHGDVEEGDGDKIRTGLGCPSCAFGTRCTSCYGKGVCVPNWNLESTQICGRCDGTGEFIPEKEGEHFFEGLASLLDASDEDPIDLIMKYETGL